MKNILQLIKNKLFKKRFHAKYVHLCDNDKFIPPFVDFLNRNFPPSEHLFLYIKSHPHFAIPQGDNVIEVPSWKSISIDLEKTEKIICHSLFDGKVKLLYKNQHYLPHTSWVIWGADLYSAARRMRDDYVRQHIARYLVVAEGDAQVLEQKYGVERTKCEKIQYVSPISLATLEHAYAQREARDSINIQINNSACATTLDTLRELAAYRDQNIRIYTILSYGDTQHNDAIIQLGKEIYGEKFCYFDSFLSAESYAQHLAGLDIMIMSQNRQQGLANIFITLYFGVKTYIKSEISTYKMISPDFTIFDTHHIKTQDFETFIHQDPGQRQNNRERAQQYFDEQHISRYWEKVFDK